jgi:hypothetical protein
MAFLYSHWLNFSSALHIHGRLSEQLFRITGGFRKAGTSPLKRVTGRMFTIVSDFIEACRNFFLNFLYKKTAKNCESHQRSIKKYCFDF